MTLKIICSCNAAKSLSNFKHFPPDIFLFGVRKNICTVQFLDAQELHSWNTLKANVCIFLYISARKFLFRRRSKTLSDGGELVEGWIVYWGRRAVFQHFDKVIICIIRIRRVCINNMQLVFEFFHGNIIIIVPKYAAFLCLFHMNFVAAKMNIRKWSKIFHFITLVLNLVVVIKLGKIWFIAVSFFIATPVGLFMIGITLWPNVILTHFCNFSFCSK